ncbi:MAG: HAMP domain-containing protein [Sandaracinaceae bacterium]|nr:HAMP domain-containing protein [Sandaracinaceae bacterium]
MRASFRLKIASLAAVVSAVPLIALGALLVGINAREVESATQALQLALVGQLAEQVDAELARAEGALGAIAATLADGALSEDARLAAALRILDAEPALEGVAIYDADGALIDRMQDPSRDAASPDALDADLRARAEASGRASGAPQLGDGGVVRVLLVVPVRADERVTGFAAAPWSLAAIQARVTDASSALLASREGVLALVGEDGRALAHPDAAQRLEAFPARPREATRAPRSEERDEAGRTWLDTSVGLRALPWAAVASIPADVAYASLTQMQRVVAATVTLAVLAALLAALLLARRLAAPIGVLVDFTKALAARRFDRRVGLSTGDELEVLGAALDDAAAELERSEERARADVAIRADLGRYLPAELVEAIVAREQSMELGGQRRAITVLFADVVAFTPLSDRLAPEDVVAILNELFTLLTEAVFRHGGTVDKFVGDSLMALFGAPAEQPDHAARALFAAEDMMRFLESANAGFEDRYGVTIQLAIGVNTGDAVVGNVGSETRMEYTAIGDVVNVAARLETIARPSQILVTRATRDAASEASSEAFETAPVGERTVPGRAAPVELHEVRW